MKHIIIFASGQGSNAMKIVEYFKNHSTIKITRLVTNNPEAGVIQKCWAEGIDVQIVTKKSFNSEAKMLNSLALDQPDLLILAGFLWLIPAFIIKAYPQKVVNIHPALLPKFGGKGMYGMNVHKAVKAADESKSGITIHFCDEAYDEGSIIFQASCDLDKNDSPKTIAQKVLNLEHQHFAPTIEKLLASKTQL